MRAIVMRERGSHDALQLEDVQEPPLLAGHVRVRVSLAGVNAEDVLVRSGAVATGPLPCTLGTEVVGVTDDGRRVVGLLDHGGYAEKVMLPLGACWDVPPGIDDQQALALVRDGIVAWHALFTAAQVQPKETIVVTSAGTGAGALTVQLAHRFGTRVIALAEHTAERDYALEIGADAVVDSAATDLAGEVMAAAGGPVDAVVDLGGGASVARLTATVTPGGRIALYGHPPASAPPIGIDLLLGQSLTVSGFHLPHLCRDQMGHAMGMRALFATILDGTLVLPPGKTYPLEAAAQAHHDLETNPGPHKIALDVTI
ncbi:quinone oxidoreductase family protein [Actinacidiphila glaucinigra]|uniref:quinone oxidoreductase family protein n=1 Tax=Actinacidiphila glaucinigra TaxID=235986 RepID=UPI003D92C90C